jgi:uncharacterized membrane protein
MNSVQASGAEGLVRTDQKIDEVMGLVLRTGVILAALIVFAGGTVYLTRHPGAVRDYRVFQGEPAEYKEVPAIGRDAAALHGRGLIQFGLLVLIATPIARVVFSLFAFLWQRDWTYVVVTGIVLGLLVYSLFGGHEAG